MSASTLFDKLREENQIASDAALARELEISPSEICKYRGGREVSARVILRIHEYLGKPVVDIRELLGQSIPHQYHDNPARVSTTEASQ
jgi:predicted transcriptional regulator